MAKAVLGSLSLKQPDPAPIAAALEDVVKSYAPDYRAINEIAAEIARDSAARQIADLSAERQKVVARIVARGIDLGLDDQTIADQIAAKVGLHDKYEGAVDKYRKSLVDGGMQKGVARNLARQYAQRLRAQRALTIARTEVQRALNEAQRRIWQAEREEGVQPGGVRVTQTRPDCCALCRRERGKRRSLSSVNGGPPFHPNCHCYEVVQYQPGAVAPITKEEPVADVAKNDAHYPSLERVPGKQNWVDKTGGLPPYIDKIARHLHYERGMPIGRAIAVAKSRCELWAAGGGNVSKTTQAKAARAIAQWNAKRARAKAS